MPAGEPMMKQLIVPALLAFSLAACGGDKTREQGGKAEGTILPGSVSDAMIPVDQVKSQAPLAPQSEGTPRKEKAEAEPGEATATSAPTPGAEPSASPSAETPG